jgi:beta-lactamase class A
MRLRATRRTVLAGGLALLACSPRFAPPAAAATNRLEDRLRALEKRAGGRLGVARLGAKGGPIAGWRLDERFPMCSTYKTLAGALLLKRVDGGTARLDERLVYGRDQLVDYSPATGPHVGAPGMTLAEIAAAAIALSDNTAGNLLLDRFGGPEGLTAFLRSIDDGESRLDRREPDLNEGIPGDRRDTTTPAAMARDLGELLFGDALSVASRRQLADWLRASRTGGKRLRAGLPDGWRSGSKTGTSAAAGLAADVGVLFPPDGAEPIVVAAYLAEADYPADRQNAVLAEVGRLVASG